MLRSLGFWVLGFKGLGPLGFKAFGLGSWVLQVLTGRQDPTSVRNRPLPSATQFPLNPIPDKYGIFLELWALNITCTHNVLLKIKTRFTLNPIDTYI